MATDTTTMQGKSIMPSLTVNDLKASEAFFTGLGFEISDRWEHEGKLMGLELRAGGAFIGLSQDDGKKGTDRVKGIGVRLYIEADGDIDQIAARAKAAGVKLVKEPYDSPWGSRVFEVTEPSGFLITIGSPQKK